MIFQPVLHPLLLLLLCAPVAVVAIWSLSERRSLREPQASRNAETKRAHRMLWALRLVLLLACFVMFLRPGIPGGATQTLATDTDIVLVVDTTASIVAEDWDGQEPRLDGVREDVQAIVDEYPGARFALITFDASAQLRMPLTTDTTALISSMDVLRPEVTSQSRGSSIGIANRLLAETLKSASERSPDRSRMVFYFGDGEQTASTSPESFRSSEKYADSGMVFGYGTAAGGPMRLTTGSVTDGGTEYIEYQGEPAMSVIDEQTLQTLADELGIEYRHRTAGTEPELPEAPTTTTDYSESGTVGNVIELYWIAALVVVALLGFELARATMLIARLRRQGAPASTSDERVSSRFARSTTGSLSEETSDEGVSSRFARSTSRSLSDERSEETKRASPTSTSDGGAS